LFKTFKNFQILFFKHLLGIGFFRKIFMPVLKSAPQVNKSKCCWCGACVSVCPTLALNLAETRIQVFNEKCIKCGFCVSICPVAALSEKNGEKNE
jgi:ferredoxin